MKILLLASIATKKHHFDGERNKSADIAKALRKKHIVRSLNLSTKWIQPLIMAAFLFLAKFGKFDYILICKAPTGCSYAMGCLDKIHINLQKVILYPYGKGLEGIYSSDLKIRKRLKKEHFKEAGSLIVENERAASSYRQLGCERIFLFSVVKEVFELQENKVYHQQRTLKAIFWARIAKSKGVMLALEAVQKVNQEAGYPKFSLDIAGGNPEKDIEKEIIDKEKVDGNLHYFGSSFSINGIESYQKLQEYDINIFPTFFDHECAPGSVVDMFIAGVPTLSSTFAGYESMLTDETSYLVPPDDFEMLVQKLKYIYDHQEELFLKRTLSRKEASRYSYDSFLTFFDSNFDK